MTTLKENVKNVLYVIELLLITPFTNAKLERVFSCMNRIKQNRVIGLGKKDWIHKFA